MSFLDGGNISTCHDLVDRLRNFYLPELQNLLQECAWLRDKLGLDEKKDLQTSESRLLQFSALVGHAIKQIQELRPAETYWDGGRALMSMEAKISTTILPIKSKLLSRLSEAKREMKLDSTATFETCESAASKMQAQVQNPVAADINVRHHNGAYSFVTNCPNEIQARAAAPPTSVEQYINVPVEDILRTENVTIAHDALQFSQLSAQQSLKSQRSNQPYSIANSCPQSASRKSQGSPVSIATTHSLKDVMNNSTRISDSNNISSSEDYDQFAEFSHVSTLPVMSSAYNGKLVIQQDYINCDIMSNNSSLHQKFFGDTAIDDDDLSGFDEFDDKNSAFDDENLKHSRSENSGTDELVSSKRRKRLNQIVPNPRKPRQADYQCSKCNEVYQKTVQENPWWAVYVQECPSCMQHQIPRIDINISSNAIELDPNVVALYGEGVDDEDDEDEDSDVDNCDEETDDEEENDNSFDRSGQLAQEDASKLLVLMCHARTCSGIHASPKHAEICKSTKFLMLHIRDCNGVDIYGNDCKLPWCNPCKRMLQHLTRCYQPSKCSVCNPWSLPNSYQQLRTINEHRVQV